MLYRLDSVFAETLIVSNRASVTCKFVDTVGVDEAALRPSVPASLAAIGADLRDQQCRPRGARKDFK